MCAYVLWCLYLTCAHTFMCTYTCVFVHGSVSCLCSREPSCCVIVCACVPCLHTCACVFPMCVCAGRALRVRAACPLVHPSRHIFAERIISNSRGWGAAPASASLASPRLTHFPAELMRGQRGEQRGELGPPARMLAGLRVQGLGPRGPEQGGAAVRPSQAPLHSAPAGRFPHCAPGRAQHHPSRRLAVSPAPTAALGCSCRGQGRAGEDMQAPGPSRGPPDSHTSANVFLGHPILCGDASGKGAVSTKVTAETLNPAPLRRLCNKQGFPGVHEAPSSGSSGEAGLEGPGWDPGRHLLP